MEVNTSYSIRNSYTVSIPDIIDMLEDFDVEIKELEEQLKDTEKVIEDKDTIISENKELIAYYENLLIENNIDY